MAKVILAIFFIIVVAMCHSSMHVVAVEITFVGGDTTAPVLPGQARSVHPTSMILNSAQVFLDAHNTARTEVGVDPLTWSYDLAKSASRLLRQQKYHYSCEFANTVHGSNQLWDEGNPMNPREVVDYWVSQKQYYNYHNNSCAADKICGAYKQVVWRATQKVGCSQGVCGHNNGSLTICLYSPRGNIIGQCPY